MRDLSWAIFTKTGSIEAYLLYKELEAISSCADEKQVASDATQDGRHSDQEHRLRRIP